MLSNIKWLSQFKNVVLIGFKPGFRQWPSLVNHAYFYDIELELFQKIKGICDLKDVVQKSNLCQGKCDTLDKIHKQIYHTAVETHRAKEMTEAILRILEKLGETTKTLSTWPIDDSIKTLEKVKKKLDASLADDISQGRYYSQGHIGNFRMPENFLIEFRNQ